MNNLNDTKKNKKVFSTILSITICLISTLSALICLSSFWLGSSWSNVSIDNLIYDLFVPLEGTENGEVQKYLYYCVVPSVLLMIIIGYLSFRLKGLAKKIYFVFLGLFSLACFLISINILKSSLKVDTDVIEFSSFIEDNYIDPKNVEILFPTKKRNLIYIFVESEEITYADKKSGGAYNANYIPELTQLAFDNIDFSGDSKILNGAIPLPGSTWTIGAMFAQFSGLPLKISKLNHGDFLTNITMLGDILAEENYNQVIIFGSDANFAKRDVLFTQHGRFAVKDYYYALNNGLIPKDYKVWWGYEDERLFEFAKDELMNLSSKDEPFNLTLLTVDTHKEKGYVCRLCDNKYSQQYANVIACSSRQIDDFINWVMEQDFYKDTSIVIAGDHLTMDADFCTSIDENYTRKTYVCYINPDADVYNPSRRREYSTMDLFPTTLASIGAKIEGNKLGLGTNLFSNEDTLIEEFEDSYDYLYNELSKRTKFMDNYYHE